MTKTLFLIVLAMLVGVAQAGLIDGTVLINRAANNKTVTVQYDGVLAALVELRVNGESVSTRTVDDKLKSGETNFALNPAILKDGDNAIEVRLYDAAGKLVGRQTSSVFVDRKPTGPVYLQRPQAGGTVLGPVQIELGLRQSLRNLYVSFFIDDNFTSLRNFPPYTYLWDTTRVPNGWHEIQAWVVDDANRTFKTEKMRLYVNNPSGRTERRDPLTTSGAGETATGDPNGVRSTNVAGNGTSVTEATPPIVLANVSENNNRTTLSDSAGTIAPPIGKGDMTGQRALLPTGRRLALNSAFTSVATSLEPGDPSRLALREITFGSRVTDVKTFSVSLNGKALSFDVAPAVVDGVPFAPFRHLFEQAGGEVKWTNATKTVEASGLDTSLLFRIGDEYGTLNGTQFLFERAPFIKTGRTCVPLSFIGSTLGFHVDYDPNTGHVLITSPGKN